MFCNKCGKQIPNDSKYCPECGVNISGQNGRGDEGSFGYALLSFFIPIIGLVLFIVWNKEYPKRAKSCLYGIIAGVVIWVIFACCSFSRTNEFTGIMENIPVETDVFLQWLK